MRVLSVPVCPGGVCSSELSPVVFLEVDCIDPYAHWDSAGPGAWNQGRVGTLTGYSDSLVSAVEDARDSPMKSPKIDQTKKHNS